MIKITVKYVNFSGNEVEEDLYFNLTKTEAMEYAMAHPNLKEEISRITRQQDNLAMYRFLKEFTLMAYGVRDGENRFAKSPHMAAAFEHSPAFESLMLAEETGLMTSEENAVNFFEKILPADLLEKARMEDPNLVLIEETSPSTVRPFI